MFNQNYFLLRDSYDSKTIIAFRSNFNHEIACVLVGDLQLDGIFSKSKKSKKIGNIFNTVEDVHVEREVDKKCRSYAYKLSNIHAYVLYNKQIKGAERQGSPTSKR